MARINKHAQKCIQITYRNGFISKKIEINMGALVMFGLVSVIAIVEVIYFNLVRFYYVVQRFSAIRRQGF